MKIENGQKSADTTALFQFGLSFKDSLPQYHKSIIPDNTNNEFIILVFKFGEYSRKFILFSYKSQMLHYKKTDSFVYFAL
ncbi:hypothetical protein Dfri01_07200 [Dyadobacter frigoris]|nr:hypothetical protein Dfri01_07200 [Dyadobacter frigoris]